MNRNDFDQAKIKFAQSLWTLRLLSQGGQGPQLELGELYQLIESNLPLAADSYSQLFVNEQLNDQRLREEMGKRQHVLYDIPKGLFGNNRNNAECYLTVERLIRFSGFRIAILEPRDELDQQKIASWARRLVAATDVRWQDSLSRKGATTAALLPINASSVPSPLVNAQVNVDLLLEELTDTGCRYSANLFEFLTVQNRDRLGNELINYDAVVRERQPLNAANDSTLQTVADNLIDQMLDSMSSIAYRLLCELIAVKLIEYRIARRHAVQRELTDDAARYEALVSKYATLQKVYPCPENLSGV